MANTTFLQPGRSVVNTTFEYASGDVIGGLLKFSFPEIDVREGRGAILEAVMLRDLHSSGLNYVLYVFNDRPTEFEDNDVFQPAVADIDKLQAIVPLSLPTVINTVRFYKSEGLNNVLSFREGVYAYLVTNSTVTYADTGRLRLRLSLLGDVQED